ncbi:hypothetical protein C7B89_09625 [Lysinibacillus capsici]|nr:hypothetical protein C7B89_09625 [Lysinibacillus capsici]
MTPNSVQSNTILVKVVGVLYLQGKLAKIQKSTEEEPMYFRVIIHLLTSVVMDSCNRITIRLKRKTLIDMNCASQ